MSRTRLNHTIEQTTFDLDQQAQRHSVNALSKPDVLESFSRVAKILQTVRFRTVCLISAPSCRGKCDPVPRFPELVLNVIAWL
jgi:hypothetical protein